VKRREFIPGVALNGRADTHQICPVLKVDRPHHRAAVTSHFGPYPSSGVDSVVMHKHSFQFSDVLS
jgi:hypothetical protein